jgi:hypothetical protein
MQTDKVFEPFPALAIHPSELDANPGARMASGSSLAPKPLGGSGIVATTQTLRRNGASEEQIREKSFKRKGKRMLWLSVVIHPTI